MALISSDRLYTAGWATAGVVGGIPAGPFTIYTTLNPSGTTDRTSAINTAIANCPSGQAVYLTAGTYRCLGAINFTNEQGVILLGDVDANGVPTTIIDSRTTDYAIRIGNGGGDYGSAPGWVRDGTSLGANAAQGATTITVATAGFSVGDKVWFSQAPDQTLPVLYTSNESFRAMNFLTRITAIGSGNVTIADPLPFALTTALTAKMKRIMTDGWADNCGMRNIKVDCSTTTPTTGVRMYNNYNCWMDNVWVFKPNNYNFEMIYALHCEFRKCRITGQGPTGNNHSGIIAGFPSSNSPGMFMTAIYDSILEDAFPCLEVNGGSCGNVFAYNACEKSDSTTGVLGVSIDTNHCPGNSYNLYEGNIAPKLQADGYFGSVAFDTIARNRITAVNSRSAVTSDNSLNHAIDL